MGLQEDFDQAAADVNKLTSQPSQDELLKLYALFKQATVGDVNTDRPGMFDMKGKYKWDAWNALKGKSQDDAKKEYVALVGDLKGKYA